MTGGAEARRYGEALIEALPSADRRAVVVFTSAAPFQRKYGDPPMALDMAGADLSLLNSGRAPLLEDHFVSIASMIGVVERAWIDRERGIAQVRFARTVQGEAAWQMVQDGIARNCSVGMCASVEHMEPLAGTDAVLCRKWRPTEISLVAIPANWQAMVLPPDLAEEELRGLVEARQAVEHYRETKRWGAELQVFAMAAAPALAKALGAAPELVAEVLHAEAMRLAE